jgi:hypothetical protein
MPDFLAFTLRGVAQIDKLVASLETAGLRLDGLAAAATATLAASAAAVFEDELHSAAPVGKGETAGQLRDSLKVTVRGEGKRKIVSAFGDDPPLSFILYGTRPHIIAPRTAQALAFTVGGMGGTGGTMVFARLVHHPGTRSNDFVRAAWIASRPKIAAELALAAEEIKVGFQV